MSKSLQLIVALDFDNKKKTLALVDKLDPAFCALKVGSELFTRFGAGLVKLFIARGFKVFLDLKFHDIPNTVARACMAAADMGVWMMNVHACGGLAMMQAASKALEPYGVEKPLVIAVTVLTSFDEHELVSIGVNRPLIEQVKQLALLAKEAGLDGVVSSAREVAAIKACCGSSFIAVTPGIRFADSKKHDQKRDMTPQHAIICGSDFLVVGRSITEALDPALVISQLHGCL